MKLIKSFRMSTKNITPSIVSRGFTVTGDEGAVFSLKVRRSNGDLYNFKNSSFDTSVNSNNSEHVLSNKQVGSVGYTSSVLLPSETSGDEYSFMLFAEPHFDTKLSKNLVTIKTTGSGDTLLESTSYNPYFYTTKITQDADSVATITLASKAHASKYQSFGTDAANVTITKNVNIKGSAEVDFAWTVKATEADDSNGFQLVRQPIGSDFEVSSTQSLGGTAYLVSAAIIASKQLRLATIDGLGIGDYISNNYSGSIKPVIDSIDEETKTITLNIVQTLSVGTALTFTGGGSSAVENYSGMGGVEFTKLKAEVPTFTVKLNGAHSGAGAIGVDNAKGLFLGQTIKGVGFDNTTNGEMSITAINRSGNTFTVQEAQALKDNIELTISGGGNEANIKGKFRISSAPISNTTITFDLDSILRPKGVS